MSVKIQDTEGCCDLQVQRMLCDLLQDLQMPPDVWKQQMEATSQIQYQARQVHRCHIACLIVSFAWQLSTQQRIDACANIFEQCLTSPSKAALYAQQIAQVWRRAEYVKSYHADWSYTFQTVSPADMLEHISIPLWYVFTAQSASCAIKSAEKRYVSFALYKTCYPIEMAPLEENLQKLKLLPVKSPKVRTTIKDPNKETKLRKRKEVIC